MPCSTCSGSVRRCGTPRKAPHTGWRPLRHDLFRIDQPDEPALRRAPQHLGVLLQQLAQRQARTRRGILQCLLQISGKRHGSVAPR
ncbi:hypothetical protein D3C84_1074830 [compost metagenome]